MIFKFLAAGAPMLNPGHQAPTDPNAVHYVFSGNWAAVIGAFMCLTLLLTWFHYKIKPLDDAEEDKTPGKDKPTS